jgi:hypothetical protein
MSSARLTYWNLKPLSLGLLMLAALLLGTASAHADTITLKFPVWSDPTLVRHDIHDMACCFHNDTLYLALLESIAPDGVRDSISVSQLRAKYADLYTVSGDSLCLQYSTQVSYYTSRFWLTDDLKLIVDDKENITKIRPLQDETQPEKIEINWYTDPVSGLIAYLPGDDFDYGILQDLNYTRTQLAIDNINRQYPKQYLCKMKDGHISKAEMIRGGRISCRDFSCFREGDSIFAVWSEGTRKPIAWSDGGHYVRSIVYSVFDGKSWSEPVSAVSDPTVADDYFAGPLKLFRHDGSLYLLWRQSIVIDEGSGYYLRLSKQISDGEWETLESDDPGCRDVLCDPVVDSGGSLHLLWRSQGKKKRIRYAVVSGDHWQVVPQTSLDPNLFTRRFNRLRIDNESRAWLVSVKNGEFGDSDQVILQLIDGD